jgi:hypothetical protein
LAESGRIYKLIGRGSGIGINAAYVWSTWKRKTGATEVVDVTKEVEELLSKKEHCPCTLEKLNRAREEARVNGTESSAYFMDKCGAEAGDFEERK